VDLAPVSRAFDPEIAPVNGLRICRFCADDEIPLIGLYHDEFVIPLDSAAELWSEVAPSDLRLDGIETPLDLLTHGHAMRAVRELAAWICDDPDAPPLSELALPVGEVRLLTPLERPGKILLLAGNYAAHIAERGGIASERENTFPYVFMKPASCLNPPGGPIRIPRVSPNHVDWECELGVVMGRTCRHVEEDEALEYVAGYTVVNDVSDRKFFPNPARTPRDRDRFFDWLHGKWHDSFLPMGPCLLAADAVEDPQDLQVRLTVNDKVRQDGSTSRMIFPVAAIIAFLSRLMTLEPGDLICTGTPEGVGSASNTYLKPGDVVVAEIDGIGRLTNPVQAEE
jgi:2-keto-4-pentenoate hydratase/2-oxohepta-3-ene-1,7-dioic acid hydratase in catechol pathway